MISRNPPKFALEFFGKTILLLKTQDDGVWHEIGMADMGDPDFREMMKDFRAEVSAHGLRKPQVALMLPLEDVIVETVEGDDFQTQLETTSNSPIEELAFVVGSEFEGLRKNVFYAYRETLIEAQSFVAQFGFTTSYFSARVDLDGFETLPQITLNEPKTKAAIGAYLPTLATAAVVAIGAFSMWAYSDNTAPQSTNAASFVSVPAPVNQTVASVVSASYTPVSAPELPKPSVVSVRDKDAQALNVSTPVADTVIRPAQSITTALDVALQPAPAQVASTPVVSAPQSLSATVADATPPLRPVSLAISPVADADPTDIQNKDQAARLDLDALVVGASANVETTMPQDANYPRPPLRSGTRTTVQTVAVQTPTLPAQPAVARPRHRPSTLATPSSQTTQTTQAAIAEDLLQQAITQDAAANDSLVNASRLAKGTAKRPPVKRSDFKQRVASLNSSPKKTAPAATTRTTTTAAASKPAIAPAPSSDEKETRASTTFNKRSLSLVGVFGTSSRRNALFRTAGGSYRSVKIGQRVSGWKVVAIGESSVKVSKGSRSKTMRLPQ